MSVTYNQKGYVGQSMSVRAKQAYDNGEMPWSKWTKKAIIQQLQYDDYDSRIIDWAKVHKVEDCREELLEPSSWHHTSKYANVTRFYSLKDNDSLLIDLLLMTYEEKWEKLVEFIDKMAKNHVKMEIHKDLSVLALCDTSPICDLHFRYNELDDVDFEIAFEHLSKLVEEANIATEAYHKAERARMIKEEYESNCIAIDSLLKSHPNEIMIAEDGAYEKISDRWHRISSSARLYKVNPAMMQEWQDMENKFNEYATTAVKKHNDEIKGE